jgi:3-oxoacid CoA-transferase subunit A
MSKTSTDSKTSGHKVYPDAASALQGIIKDGVMLMCGGFGLCGVPERLISALHDSGAKNLTVVSNNAGIDGAGLGLLLQSRQIRKMISSYVGENKEFERQYLARELELEFNPQGTLAERIRAGGAGIYAFFTRTGAGTLVAEGKEQRVIDGETYVLETGLVADVSLVKAWKGDTEGNLIYRKTARNFNPNMATAGRITVAEVEILVEAGELDPDQVHTPGIFVKRIIDGSPYHKLIEKRTVRKRKEGSHAVVA